MMALFSMPARARRVRRATIPRPSGVGDPIVSQTISQARFASRSLGDIRPYPDRERPFFPQFGG